MFILRFIPILLRIIGIALNGLKHVICLFQCSCGNKFRSDSPLSGWPKTYQVGQEYTLIVCVCVVNNMFQPDIPLSDWLKSYQVGQEYTLIIICVVKNNMFRSDSPLSGRIRLLVNLMITYPAETCCWMNTKIKNCVVTTGFTDTVNRVCCIQPYFKAQPLCSNLNEWSQHNCCHKIHRSRCCLLFGKETSWLDSG